MNFNTYLALCKKALVAPSRVPEEIGLSRSSYYAWQKGSQPTLKTESDIAKFFGVDIHVLNSAPSLVDNLEVKEFGKGRIHTNNFVGKLTDEDISILQAFQSNASLRLLFHSAKNATDEQIIETALELEKLKKGL